jgi:secreted PhoX family phosphatase
VGGRPVLNQAGRPRTTCRSPSRRPAVIGEDANQFLAGITPRGQTFPLAHNRMSDEEFAGATFSPDGGTLFVNVQVPGTTFAIWGPWR